MAGRRPTARADAVPGPSTLWSIESGDVLTETTPVTLVWDNGAGLIFRRTIAVDANFMFTTTQSVENTTGAEVRLAPYGIIARHGMPSDLMNFYILHEGVIIGRRRRTDRAEIQQDHGPAGQSGRRRGEPDPGCAPKTAGSALPITTG